MSHRVSELIVPNPSAAPAIRVLQNRLQPIAATRQTAVYGFLLPPPPPHTHLSFWSKATAHLHPSLPASRPPMQLRAPVPQRALRVSGACTHPSFSPSSSWPPTEAVQA